MLQMKFDHTKGAIIPKHAINNSENEHGFPQQKAHPFEQEHGSVPKPSNCLRFQTLKISGSVS